MLGESDTRPDFACHHVAVGEEIRYIHRNFEGDDLYFVASAVREARRFLSCMGLVRTLGCGSGELREANRKNAHK
jgi:hypothetical protein